MPLLMKAVRRFVYFLSFACVVLSSRSSKQGNYGILGCIPLFILLILLACHCLWFGLLRQIASGAVAQELLHRIRSELLKSCFIAYVSEEK